MTSENQMIQDGLGKFEYEEINRRECEPPYANSKILLRSPRLLCSSNINTTSLSWPIDPRYN